MSTVEQPASATAAPTSTRWRPLTWIAIFLALAPMFVWYLCRLWHIEHYQFYPFVGLFVAVILYQRWDRIVARPDGWFAYSLLGVALLASLVGIKAASPWLVALAVVMAAGAFLFSHRDHEGIRLLYLWPLFWLVLRLPMNRDERLINWLQRNTTELSSVVLSLLNIPHIVRGAILDLPTRELFVAEACSGIKSLFTMLFVAMALMVWKQRRMWLLPLYLVAAGVLAVLANLLRISAIAIAEYYWQWDVSTGWQHEVLGYVALVLGIGLLLSADRLFCELGAPIAADLVDDEESPITSIWNRIVSSRAAEPSYDRERDRTAATSCPVSCLVVCSLLLILTSWRTIDTPDDFHTNPRGTPPVLLEPDVAEVEAAMAPIICGNHTAARDREDPRLGVHSDLWEVEVGGQSGQIVISQPYNGWKELTHCYESVGCQLVAHKVTKRPTEAPMGDRPWISQASLQFDDGSWGLLTYAAVNARGELVRPPHAGLLSEAFARLRKITLFARPVGQTVAVQCWVVTADPPSETLKAETLTLVDNVRHSVQSQLSSEKRMASDE
ncbi:exosortase U [Roseimaritima sediminicola]|uniref:exosortase U n=1 Tax=Roseimaritima sediminicola TaxID=2662066 RepID=UPI00138751D2|nr:exosortase U [Roseimaritima sediminicola]